ncbi:MAG: hypothetical protein ACT4ON_01100 [Bacteroidota bacterium]
MKTQFDVPADSIVEFAEILSENELTNEIIGVTDDDELIIEVQFDKSQFKAVEELEELVESNEETEEGEED